MISKLFLATLFSVFSISALAQNTQYDLSDQDQAIILDQLNDICGDIWCEGDYELTFNSIEFNSEDNGFYQLDLSAQEGAPADQVKDPHQISCQIDNLELIQKVIFNVKKSHSDESEYDFYFLINDCLDKKLYKLNRG